MEDGGMSYPGQQQQMQVPNPPQSPMQHPSHPSQHSNHPMGSGGQQQQGGPPGGPHCQQNQSSNQYNQQQHSYQDAAKPKKGHQLWNRMKREFLRARAVAAAAANMVPCRCFGRLLPPSQTPGSTKWGRQKFWSTSFRVFLATPALEGGKTLSPDSHHRLREERMLQTCGC